MGSNYRTVLLKGGPAEGRKVEVAINTDHIYVHVPGGLSPPDLISHDGREPQKDASYRVYRYVITNPMCPDTAIWDAPLTEQRNGGQ